MPPGWHETRLDERATLWIFRTILHLWGAPWLTAGDHLGRARHLDRRAWSCPTNRIARTIGEKAPLKTERSYNTTLRSDAFDLGTQVTFGGHGYVVTRLSSGIRVGGAVEFGGPDNCTVRQDLALHNKRSPHKLR